MKCLFFNLIKKLVIISIVIWFFIVLEFDNCILSIKYLMTLFVCLIDLELFYDIWEFGLGVWSLDWRDESGGR